jgi:hypothetical protein
MASQRTCSKQRGVSDPRQLEPQGRSRAKKKSNSKWVPSDDEPPDVRNLPGSDGQSVPGTDIRPATLFTATMFLFKAGRVSREEALKLLDFDPIEVCSKRELLAFYEATELLPDGTRRWRKP